MNALEKLLGPKFFLRRSEAFDGSLGGIWTTAEGETFEDNGLNTVAFDYYGEEHRDMVHPKVKELLTKYGWGFEFNDPGTVLLHPEE
tara:strand:- start:726 stop:986 length:261 start_codon:yes stop_codon:yes gene_type:complete